jgi:hypothetical protein
MEILPTFSLFYRVDGTDGRESCAFHDVQIRLEGYKPNLPQKDIDQSFIIHRLGVKNQAAQKVTNQTFQPTWLLLVGDKRGPCAFLALFKF